MTNIARYLLGYSRVEPSPKLADEDRMDWTQDADAWPSDEELDTLMTEGFRRRR